MLIYIAEQTMARLRTRLQYLINTIAHVRRKARYLCRFLPRPVRNYGNAAATAAASASAAAAEAAAAASAGSRQQQAHSLRYRAVT